MSRAMSFKMTRSPPPWAAPGTTLDRRSALMMDGMALRNMRRKMCALIRAGFLLWLLAGPLAALAAQGRILVYGDSLSASYGIGQKEGWVALLEERLRKDGLDYSVANASISGETSSGG